MNIESVIADAPASAAAQPQAVAPVEENTEVSEITQETEGEEAKPEPKEVTAADELEKLRRAKARDDRRIGKLTAQKYQAMKEAEELRARLSANEPKPTANPTGEPKESDFQTYAEYIEARAEWKMEQKLAERDSKQQQSQRSSQEQQWVAEREHYVAQKAQELIKTNPEVMAVIEEHADLADEFPPHIQKALLEADNAPLAFYNLAQAGKLEELATMSELDAKVEIRLAQLSQPSKPKTNAPAPLTPARGSAAGIKPVERMSPKEILALARS